LTADGRLKNCLFSSHEIDVKGAVQARDLEGVLAVIAESLECKTYDKNVLPGRTARGMSQVGG
jgi:molybdenum cofactor biosynthesis enzyme MoaA